MSTSTRFTTSADGTRIAYEVRGQGPALVNVDGALCSRQMGPSKGLAEQLAGEFSVYTYDRRGRGESGLGTGPYAVQREVEDLLAVIAAAGGRAAVLGSSSGAALALDAARQDAPIERLAVYEAPFIVDDTHAPHDAGLGERTQELVDAGRTGDAVRLFLRTVGMPAPMVGLMRFLPPWKQMVSIAPTLPHDYAVVLSHQQGRPLPEGYYDAVVPETLVMAGGKSPAYMQNSQAAIAAALPHARLETLPGQTHLIKPKVVAAAVAPFLRG
ncbi:alpha/beta fold hydrolase [uncultured Friedmanniella sp.]|uniref:alpha/beta fold hydrolase n=1 Tax=uncultured Friedmanniella sp. TaxID=335381 RepID=UPI0035CC8866